MSTEERMARFNTSAKDGLYTELPPRESAGRQVVAPLF
jgi:hypothetical protein